MCSTGFTFPFFDVKISGVVLLNLDNGLDEEVDESAVGKEKSWIPGLS